MSDPEGVIANYNVDVELSEETDVFFTISELANGGFFKKLTKGLGKVVSGIGKVISAPGKLL